MQWQSPDSFTWHEHAVWLREHLGEMQFEMNPQYVTLASVRVNNDTDDIVERVTWILEHLFGAYMTGPMSNAPQDSYQTFGFWNDALLANARKVFPLPENLHAGPIVAVNISPNVAKYWTTMERIYNKKVEQLPSYGTTRRRENEHTDR